MILALLDSAFVESVLLLTLTTSEKMSKELFYPTTLKTVVDQLID
jgi:hypothetical protein